jgi:hypothetical protein
MQSTYDASMLPTSRSEGVLASRAAQEAPPAADQSPHQGQQGQPSMPSQGAGASPADPVKVASAFPVSARGTAAVATSAMAAKPLTVEDKSLATLEKLHAMMTKGIVSAEEYEKQKAELLAVGKMEKLHGLMLKGIISAEEYEAQKADLLQKLH